MSQPARDLRPRTTDPAGAKAKTAAAPARTRARPSRTSAARPLPITPPQPRRRARRGPPLTFWILAATIVSVLVVSVVSVSALLVQTSFRIDQVQGQLSALGAEQQRLTREVASLSAPGRIHAWARGEGMTMPESVVVLPVPIEPAGAPTP